MKEHISEEIIEIDGKEYNLFLNRKGIINWEQKTQFLKNIQETANKVEEINEKVDIEITDDTNPFEMYDDYDEETKNAQDDIDRIRQMYKILYWVAFYTHHKFGPNKAYELFDKAEEEYGLEQLIDLGNMMIENANKDISPKKQLKNLLARKSTK